MPKVLTKAKAVRLGYPADKHKRRRLHRSAAKELLGTGTFLNATTPRNSTLGMVAQWHLVQARWL